MTTTYYVQARISDDGLYAECGYFYDKAGTQPVEGTTLNINLGEEFCAIEEADGSALVLLGASFKTLGHAPVMREANFAATDGTSSLGIPMPAGQVVTKGVVLLFSNPGAVESLYASSDPEVTNGGRSN